MEKEFEEALGALDRAIHDETLEYGSGRVRAVVAAVGDAGVEKSSVLEGVKEELDGEEDPFPAARKLEERLRARLVERSRGGVGSDAGGVVLADVESSVLASRRSLVSQREACRPWDRDAFRGRVSTFSPSTWLAKPVSASPLVCARWGWVNVGRDMLHCRTCGRFLSLQSTSTSSVSSTVREARARVAAERVREFGTQLRTGHATACPWSACPSPQSFVTFSPVPSAGLVRDFGARVRRLSELALPPISLDRAVEYASHLIDGVQGKSSETIQSMLFISLTMGSRIGGCPIGPTPSAVTLMSIETLNAKLAPHTFALFGWDVDTPHSLRCQWCQRTIRLPRSPEPSARIQSPETTSSGLSPPGTKRARAEDSSEPDSKRPKQEVVSMDPERRHAHFCPLIRNTAKLPQAWKSDSTSHDSVRVATRTALAALASAALGVENVEFVAASSNPALSHQDQQLLRDLAALLPDLRHSQDTEQDTISTPPPSSTPTVPGWIAYFAALRASIRSIPP